MSEVDRQMREAIKDFIEKFGQHFDPDFETGPSEMIEYIREVILEEA
jgi:hypothetical protein